MTRERELIFLYVLRFKICLSLLYLTRRGGYGREALCIYLSFF